ncbi:elongator complex protein 5 [Aquila chrysaetos chrysaetos]|uniref:elongator complex protein 5 n=1 Tax=Aquila chrysaetos chrysaetos TaxID=223781 RepID=UPI001176E383|nr:elongator complex protein 5 [Aquila chrysaetos chrysaetos]
MAAPFAVRRRRHREAPPERGGARRRTAASSGGAGSAMLEALVAGGAEGLVLVRDNAACEGRSLLRAFVTAAVQRAERVLVVLFDVPREQFEAGLSPSVKEQLLYRDGFTDPLGWSGPDPDLRAGDFGGLLAGGLPSGGAPDAGAGLTQLAAAAPAPPLPLPGPGGPAGGGPPAPDESFTLLPDGSLRSLGVPTPTPEEEDGRPPPSVARTPGSPRDSGGRAPSHPLTFRLQLSAAERAARAAVPPPYQLSTPKRSTLLRTPGTIVCALEPPEDEDPEDPDDDLDV